MNAPPRPSGRSSLPAGLLGMLALAAALEWAVFRNNPHFSNEHAACWSYVDRHAGRKARGREILCMGDSLVKFGVLPSVLSERTGKSAYNLGLFSGPAPASYFLLRRTLEEGGRPSAIIVDFAAGILTAAPRSTQRAYPWAELLRPGEAFDLAWSSRDPALLARIVLAQALHSFKLRFEIRAGIRDALKGERNHQPIVLAINRRNWNQNDGAQAQAKRDFVDYPPPDGPSPEPTWKCDPVNEAYLRRFLDLAERHRIAVYWLIPPYSPGAQAHNEHRGEDALYDGFARRMQARFANVVVVDARHSGFARTSFFDHAHLDCEGAAALSAAIAEVMGRNGVAGRWIPLPTPRATAARLEDTAQSILAVKGNARRARR